MRDNNIREPRSFVKENFRQLDGQGFFTEFCTSTGASSCVYVCVVARMLFERRLRPYDNKCEQDAIRLIQAEFIRGEILQQIGPSV